MSSVSDQPIFFRRKRSEILTDLLVVKLPGSCAFTDRTVQLFSLLSENFHIPTVPLMAAVALQVHGHVFTVYTSTPPGSLTSCFH